MTEPRDIRDDLEPGLADIGDRLRRERPVPRAAFRGELRRRLLIGAAAPSPRRQRLAISAYAGSGAVLLTLAAIGLLGAGPFSA
jgi:hypothetical protein